MYVMYIHPQVEYDRRRASPAMRLLDEALSALGEPGEPGETGRLAAAAARMRQAFTGGALPGVDIFAAAAALAAGPAAAAEEMSVERVALVDFLGEAGALLRDVTAQQEAVAKALAQFDAEVAAAAASQPALLETPAAKEQIARMAAARAASAGRAGAARQLADLLRVAQAMAGEDPGQWAQ